MHFKVLLIIQKLFFPTVDTFPHPPTYHWKITTVHTADVKRRHGLSFQFYQSPFKSSGIGLFFLINYSFSEGTQVNFLFHVCFQDLTTPLMCSNATLRTTNYARGQANRLRSCGGLNKSQNHPHSRRISQVLSRKSSERNYNLLSKEINILQTNQTTCTNPEGVPVLCTVTPQKVHKFHCQFPPST